ncbi:hypothetical protein Hanom_Chr17g01526451 [Helianthus anomalus]
MVSVMFTTSMHQNHHSGTWLYLLINLVCMSTFFSLKLDLLCSHISLYTNQLKHSIFPSECS